MSYNSTFISIIVIYYEPVVQEEPRIALPTIGVKYHRPSLYVLISINYESLSLIRVHPGSLLWTPMVEHISKRNKCICFNTIYGYSKDPTTGCHPSPAELVEGIDIKFRSYHTDVIVVSM